MEEIASIKSSSERGKKYLSLIGVKRPMNKKEVREALYPSADQKDHIVENIKGSFGVDDQEAVELYEGVRNSILDNSSEGQNI